MFYIVDVLRKRGRFYVCWVAQTYPKKFASLRRRKIESQNIPALCDDILRVINSETRDPRNRYSLRLSCQLTAGIVFLYQRQVKYFMDDLFNLESVVLRQINRIYRPVEDTVRPRRRRHPAVVQREQVDVTEQVEIPERTLEDLEQILTTNLNTVAHVDAITLKESTLQENRLLVDDNFGELNPHQAIQDLHGILMDVTVKAMLIQKFTTQESAMDASVEAMMAQKFVLQVSAMDTSVRSLNDASRLDVPAQDLERISEYDMNTSHKQIPEIPSTAFPVPGPAPNMHDFELSEFVPEPSTSELVLEELEELPETRKRQRINTELVIDTEKRIPMSVIKANIENLCNAPRPAVIYIDVKSLSEGNLFERMSKAIPLTLGRYSATALNRLKKYFYKGKRQRSIATNQTMEPVRVVPEIEIVNVTEPPEMAVNTTGQNIPMDTSEMPIALATSPAPATLHAPATSPAPVTLHAPAPVTLHAPAPSPAPATSYALATSPAPATSYAPATSPAPAPALLVPPVTNKRVSETQIQAKRPRTSASDTFRLEDVPKEVAQLLDNQDKIQPTLQDRPTRHYRQSGESSETPLGSLDRTPVSLGDTDTLTDSKKLFLDEWGPKGTMIKIHRMIKAGTGTVTVESLVEQGPLCETRVRMVAARCFLSILKLKSLEFIEVIKKPNTNDIEDIRFGKKTFEIKH